MGAALVALLLLACLGEATALADTNDASATPSAPSLPDVLQASGISASGYLDGTYSYLSQSPAAGSSQELNNFALNQASATIAYTPAAGFGVLVNPVLGTEACDACYAPGYGTVGASASTSSINLLQAYVQYVSGKATVFGGKFLTLAGFEGAVPTTNVNVTRSLLFWYSEPTTHVGVRLAYAAADSATITVGINNGWNTDRAPPNGGKTAELQLNLTPSKAVSFAATGYYGAFDLGSGVVGNRTLIDAVGTWSATSALTVVLNGDWNQQEHASGPGTASASWYGFAGYLNYSINPLWRTSLRLEYLDDQDGFNFGSSTKVHEGTLTFGYMPSKHIELRPEIRYDTFKSNVGGNRNVTQGWLQALYKF